MPTARLTGKTVMIATGNIANAQLLRNALTALGLNVVFTEATPIHAGSIDAIAKETQTHIPKIDAFIVYDSNLALPESKVVALELTKRLKASHPVIVCDGCDDDAIISAVEKAGASFLDTMRKKLRLLAFDIGYIIDPKSKAQSAKVLPKPESEKTEKFVETITAAPVEEEKPKLLEKPSELVEYKIAGQMASAWAEDAAGTSYRLAGSGIENLRGLLSVLSVPVREIDGKEIAVHASDFKPGVTAAILAQIKKAAQMHKVGHFPNTTKTNRPDGIA